MVTTETFEMRNYMEVCVNNLVDKVMASLGSCTCDNCRLDVMAIALNKLPPKYIVTARGELYSKINNLRHQFDVDVMAAITSAIVLVSRNPRHESA